MIALELDALAALALCVSADNLMAILQEADRTDPEAMNLYRNLVNARLVLTLALIEDTEGAAEL